MNLRSFMRAAQRAAVVLSLCAASVVDDSHFASGSVFGAAAFSANATDALAYKQYYVSYRHSEATNGEWRKGCDWTDDYTYAKGVFDNLANAGYEVRLYERTVR
jgi:hypothetical protein